MSNAEYSTGSIPPRTSGSKTLQPYEFDDYQSDAAPPYVRVLNGKMILRSLQRYWWQALTIWAVGSAVLMVVTYFKIKPMYEAIAQIRVEQGADKLFTPNGGVQINFDEYKETQVRTMTNPTVIGASLAAHPTLVQLPKLRQSEDPEAEIRSSLQVMIVPRTNLIQVQMTSEYPLEAVNLVNGVVESFLKVANESNDRERQIRIRDLQNVAEERKKAVEEKRLQLVEAQKKQGNIEVDAVKSKNVTSTDQYALLTTELMHVEIERIAAEAYYNQQNNDRSTPMARNAGPQQIDQQLNTMFNEHPQVVKLREGIASLESKMGRGSNSARKPNDPSITNPKKERDQLERKLAHLRDDLMPTLNAQLSGQTSTEEQAEGLRLAKSKLDMLISRETGLQQKMTNLSIKSREAGNHALALQFLNTDMTRAESVYESIQRTLDQAIYESRNPPARCSLQFLAKPTARPNSNNRLKVMAIAPVGMLVAIFALLVFMEKHAARVSDPDELPSRLNLQVLGVVPPLPQIKPNSHYAAGGAPGAGDYRSQRQLDEFVQSLDHLRVALVNGKGARGQERRCLLITSACGSEGKTTLAAQLAERCVNAGLTTLLIDADLRNPTLSRVLDVPDRLGLVNVLRDEIAVEEALTVVGGAGGFHLLPAGTPRVDPSRLLHGDRLGKMLAQLRESFDIVIVDAPPVLPVPDALTIGRWTDGAVLAVRYDTSRYPLVERANRRLASVGVSVIGAVVNGVRTSSSSYYGSYYPTTSMPQPDNSMLDV